MSLSITTEQTTMAFSGDSISELLLRMNRGDNEASSELMATLYEELHQLAASLMKGQNAGQTLQATALVNEAYLKLIRPSDRQIVDRKHFISRAASTMRSVLVDAARKRGRRPTQPLDHVVVQFDDRAHDLLGLSEALDGLRAVDPQMAELVDLRFFGGLTMEESASVMGLSKRAAERRWTLARAILLRELSTEQ